MNDDNCTEILLVNPGNYILEKKNGEVSRKNAAHPLGLACLAGFLDSKGMACSILDTLVTGYDHEERVSEHLIRYGLSASEIERQIRKVSPGIVGVTTTHSCRIPLSLEICRIVKSINKNIVTVLGGNHASAMTEECMGYDEVDYVIIGEGEYSFYELIQHIRSGKDTPPTIDGLGFKQQGRICINPKKSYIEDLEPLPMPAWHKLPMHLYSQIGKGPGEARQDNYAILVTSRGCPHKCFYCPVHVCWGHKYTSESPEKVVRQIEHLIQVYGINTILFEEHNFIANRDRVFDICNIIIKKKIKFRWAVPNGIEINKLDKTLLETMKAAGCYALHLAIESGSKERLKKINKNVDLDQTRHIIAMGRQMGFTICAFFMLGYPNQPKEEIEQTVAYAQTLDLDHVHFFIATPIPGTPMYEYCVRHDLLVEGFDYTHLRYAICNIKNPDYPPDYIEFMRRKGWQEIMGRKD